MKPAIARRIELFALIPVVCAIFAQPVLAQSLTTAIITDPSLGNMKAFTITIPAGWKFQGTVVRGPECSPISFPVFRSYAADGLTEMRLMPAFSGSFHPAIETTTVAGCLPVDHTLTAGKFLDHFVELISGGVHVVGMASVGQAYQVALDAAALRVEFVIEQRLRAWVECRTNNQAGKFSGGGCSAHVDVLRAPKGKLDALIALVDAHDLTKPVDDQPWVAAIMQRQQREGAARIAALQKTEGREMDMLHTQYEQMQATMNRNHAAFMAQQESQFRSATNNANNAMNARTTAASDWVDYASHRLGRHSESLQRVLSNMVQRQEPVVPDQ